MKTSDQINEISKAMALAQAQMRPAIKDATNPAFKFKFATFGSVWDAIRDPLTSHGIAVWQDVVTTLTDVMVTTRLAHSSGQWIEFGPLSIPLGKKAAQGVGSGITYAKRYALSAAVGVVADEDDDGEIATARARSVPQVQVINVKQLKDLVAMIKQDQNSTELQALILKRIGVPGLESIPAERYDALVKFVHDRLSSQSTISADEAEELFAAPR